MVASLFVAAIVGHAAWVVFDKGLERGPVIWLCLQIGALGLVGYFWYERSESARHALYFAAIANAVALGVALAFPDLVSWALRKLWIEPLPGL